MDIQIVLQHIFGFIGIYTTVRWLYKLALNFFNKTTVRKCHKCGCTELSYLRSLNVKKCTSCSHEMEWNLDPGQMPLVRNNRMVKRNKP